MVTLAELNVNRVSNIMSARTSNTKQKVWPSCQTAEQIQVKNIETIIVEGWKFIQDTYLLLTYFSQSDYYRTIAVKVPLFKRS